MKTIQELEKLALDIQQKYSRGTAGFEKKEISYDMAQLAFYRKMILYLKSEPREEFLKEKLVELVNRVDRITADATPELMRKIFPLMKYGKAASQWKKEHNVANLVDQVYNIKFLLDL